MLEAELLLCYALGVEKEYLFAHDEEVVEQGLVDLFLRYVERVAAGEPVAYIIGEKEFYGLNFYVDKRVLIPRPETEQLVGMVLDYLRRRVELDPDAKFKLLDVGTGSANIPVSVVRTFQEEGFENIEEVLALEIDSGAVEVAKSNVEQHNLETIVNVFQSDLLEAVEDGEYFDVITANLPYIGESVNNFVEQGVKDHEPGLALFAGQDGLDLYKKMFQELTDKSVNFGVFVGEFGDGQEGDMRELLNTFFGQNFAIEKDFAEVERFFVVSGAHLG